MTEDDHRPEYESQKSKLLGESEPQQSTPPADAAGRTARGSLPPQSRAAACPTGGAGRGIWV